MRTKILLTSIAIVAVGTAWWHEHVETIRLQAELAFVHDAHRELTALQAEHEQLSADHADRLAALRHANTARNRLLLELDARKTAAQPAPFSLGEWIPSRAWENRGQATPRATIETALWAAAGGDVSSLESMLELDAATLAKSQALLDILPPEFRSAYPTPQALIATVTTKNIPLAEAQIAWLHESDADHAAVGLLMSNPDTTSAPTPHDESPAPPPMQPENSKVKLVTLSLHRTNAGWRLVVPATAIDRIAREFSAKTFVGPM